MGNRESKAPTIRMTGAHKAIATNAEPIVIPNLGFIGVRNLLFAATPKTKNNSLPCDLG